MFSFAQPASCGNKEELSEAEAWSSTPLSHYVSTGWLSAVLFTLHGNKYLWCYMFFPGVDFTRHNCSIFT